MKQDELNECFRNLIIELSELGYAKTNIGKILFGLSAFSQVTKFIAGINNPDQKINFGLSPLKKIGQLLDNDLYLVYIDPNDRELLTTVYNRNLQFKEELKVKIKNYLDENINPKNVKDNDKLKKDVEDILSLLTS